MDWQCGNVTSVRWQVTLCDSTLARGFMQRWGTLLTATSSYFTTYTTVHKSLLFFFRTDSGLFTNTSEHIHFYLLLFFCFFFHFLVVGSTETRTRSVEPINLLITNMGRLILPLVAVVSRGPSAKTARHNKRGNLHNMTGAYKPHLWTLSDTISTRTVCKKNCRK